MVMGAHAAPPVRPPTTTTRTTFLSINTPRTTTIVALVLVFLSILSSCAVVSFGAGPSSEALLKFKSSLSNAEPSLSNWNPSTKPCSPGGNNNNWAGVICHDGKVWGLQLEKMGLSGKIDVDSLVTLPLLRSLSIMDNNLDGPMPDFRKLGALKSLYLSNNSFSGDIADDAFMDMHSLKKVYMANNNFTGKIPTSLAKSPRLLELRIEGNHFVGTIPDFPPDLKFINVSNNQLDGPLPKTLKDMDPSSFSGNKDLCGKPLDSVCKTSSPPTLAADDEKLPSSGDDSLAVAGPSGDDHSTKNSSISSIIKTVVIVLVSLVALAAIALLLIAYRRRHYNQIPQLGRTVSSSHGKKNNHLTPTNTSTTSTLQQRAVDSPETTMAGAGEAAAAAAARNVTKQQAASEQHGRLTFVREDRQRFELQDLLRASAEVLGSGSFGSSYKAVLMDGQSVVVKRFKQMNNVGREEFHEHMRRLGRLRHSNLLPLVAYYYRKEEKLLVFDFVQNGSLASHLHGNRSVDQPGLDWPTRLKIIKGVTKGLAYLHSELPSVIVPHGHLKSSNVLLDKAFDPVLMDYTLVPVVNIEQAQQLMVAYKSPEYAHQGRTTKKTDVWSLGILILEVLTGKFPANYLAHGAGYGADLASWVNSIIGEEGAQVFDREIGGTKDAQGELLKLLKIGVACCQEDLEARLDLKEAVEQIDLLKERDD
ncbi:hypothetical protein LguiA_028918 [Lonicera macranthoides]